MQEEKKDSCFVSAMLCSKALHSIMFLKVKLDFHDISTYIDYRLLMYCKKFSRKRKVLNVITTTFKVVPSLLITETY